MWRSIKEIVLDTFLRLILVLLIPYIVLYAILAGLVELFIMFFEIMADYFKWIKEGI